MKNNKGNISIIILLVVFLFPSTYLLLDATLVESQQITSQQEYVQFYINLQNTRDYLKDELFTYLKELEVSEIDYANERIVLPSASFEASLTNLELFQETFNIDEILIESIVIDMPFVMIDEQPQVDTFSIYLEAVVTGDPFQSIIELKLIGEGELINKSLSLDTPYFEFTATTLKINEFHTK